MNRQIHVQDLGKEYKAARECQEMLFNEIVRLKMESSKGNAAVKNRNILLFTMHLSVHTPGREAL